MGETLQPLVIEAFLDAGAFKKGLEEIKRGSKKIADQLTTMFRKLGRASIIAGAALGGVGAAAISAAIQVESAGRKFNAVFRGQSEAVREWAAGLGEAFALNRSDMERWLARAQDLFVPMGLAREEAAKLSQEVVELAANISVFNGQRMDETLSNIMSGLIGVTRTVRQYGILINDSRLKQKGLQSGMVGVNEEMSEQQKVLARLRIMYDDSGDALARATDLMEGGFGQAQRLKLALQNLREELGAALLPMLADIVERIAPVLKAWADWVAANQETIETIASLTAKFAVYGLALSKLTSIAGGFAAAFGAAGVAVVSMKAGLVGLGAIAAFEIAKIVEARFDLLETQAAAKSKKISEKVDKELKKLFAKRHASRLKSMRQFVSQANKDWESVWATLQEKVLGGDQLAKPLAKALAEAMEAGADQVDFHKIRSLIIDAMKPLEGRQKGPFLELFDDLKKAEEARREAFEARELTAWQALQNQRVAEAREASDQIRLIRMKNLREEISVLKKFMAEQVQIRSNAFAEIAALRASMVERQLSSEQFFFQLERQEPGADPEDRRAMTVDRIKELMKAAQFAAEDGQREFAQTVLAQAGQLAREHATEIVAAGESWSFAFSEAEEYVKGVEGMLDDLAKTEIAEQQNAAEAAAFAFEEARMLAEGELALMKEGVEDLALTASSLTMKIETEAAQKDLAKVTSQVDALKRSLDSLRADFSTSGLKIDIQVQGNLSDDAAVKLGEQIRTSMDRAGV